MFGYHGRYVKVDVGTGRGELVGLDEGILRAFLGGVGLGTWILAMETSAGFEPLGERAAVVFAMSPLVGTPLSTSAKFAVVAKSPLTGRLNDALASSRFAIAAKWAGLDAIVLSGRSERPVVVCVDGMGRRQPVVTVIDGADYWGKPASEVEESIRKKLGPEWQVASIGRAGERLIPFATVSHDGRHAGRGGLGAVLGSKGVKALAVRGDQRTELADAGRVIERARELSVKSLGPATEKYRELGTVANLLVFNRFEALPTRNFAAGKFEEAEGLVPVDLTPAKRLARKSCAACAIGCEHVFETRDGKGVRMEYETLFALGPLCGVSDPEAVMGAARRCDELGLDTISTGGTIAFLMECAEAGRLLEDRLPSGRRLRFGDGQGVEEAIEAMVSGEGLGRLLAMGSRRAAFEIGGDAVGRAMQVKGMELPGYDPRALHAMALGLAVGTRGADHNRSGAYEADFSSKVDRLAGGWESARAAVETEDLAALIDSLVLCKFLRGVFGDLRVEAAEMLGAVTGWEVSGAELEEVSRRVVNARKCFNQREGWTRAEDTLPAGLLTDDDARADGGGAPALSRKRLDAMVGSYYEIRGWDERGRVPLSLRERLGLAGQAFGDGSCR